MSSPELGNGSQRAWSGTRHGGRNLSRAVAERELGRRRLNATTATVGFASVVVAGAVAVVLPGSTHQTVTSSHSSSGSGTANTGSANSGSAGSTSTSSGSSGSGSASSNSSNSSSNSGGLQAPANTPVQSGGGQITSGGS